MTKKYILHHNGYDDFILSTEDRNNWFICGHFAKRMFGIDPDITSVVSATLSTECFDNAICVDLVYWPTTRGRNCYTFVTDDTYYNDSKGSKCNYIYANLCRELASLGCTNHVWVLIEALS